MSGFFINTTLNFIKKNGKYSEHDLLRIQYGIEGIYLTIIKIIIILLIGVIFQYLKIVILTLLFFNILRFFAFGLHAKKSWQCLILSILEFNILPYIFMNIPINNILIIIISFISLISFILFAPSDTEKRPLTNKKKRVIRKIFSIITTLVFTIIAYYSKYLAVPILCSLIIETIMVNPLSYKMLGLKYNNFKKGGKV